MLVRNAEVGGARQNVRIHNGVIAEIGGDLAHLPAEETLEAQGGALLPGLHDHHIHLHALAASLTSVECGPPTCLNAQQFDEALRRARPNEGWIRGAHYIESVAGELDRHSLDAIRSDVPIRIQHRSGAMWFLNSKAVEAIGLETRGASGAADKKGAPGSIEGIDRDAQGLPSGRFFRADRWLRERLPRRGAPDLAPVGQLLASFGVTTVTDATPTNTDEEHRLFREAQATGALPQDLRMMVAEPESPSAPEAHSTTGIPRLSRGEHKIMLDEPALPDLAGLIASIRTSHQNDRCVAIHTVTRAEIHFALAALEAAGAQHGDRLEHASVAPPEALESIVRLGLTVVTQPNFVAERGDHYLADVEPRDLPYLYRVGSWLKAGVRLAGGTDAPFGHPDPWRAMRAAVERRTPLKRLLGESERVSPETAFALFHGDALQGDALRGPKPDAAQAPLIAVGDPADLCLLDRPWSEARKNLSSEYVTATLRGGEVVYRA